MHKFALGLDKQQINSILLFNVVLRIYKSMFFKQQCEQTNLCKENPYMESYFNLLLLTTKLIGYQVLQCCKLNHALKLVVCDCRRMARKVRKWKVSVSQ